jgi:hypothetical protein
LKIRLGVLGADDSLEILQSVIDRYPEFESLPIVYWKEEEIIDLIKPYVDQVDMWLFSGQVPYTIAKEWGGISKPIFYVQHTGSSLYKTLLYIMYERKTSVSEISFDTLHPSELARILAEAGISDQPSFVKHYEGEIHAEVLAQYHYELWKEGKTKAAVTFLRTAYLELERLGVPVFRVLPAQATVTSLLNFALRTHEMLHFRDTQIAVQMIEVDSFAGLAKETFSTDEIFKMEMKVTEKLLLFAKGLQGSLKSAGPGRYVIFTTRGLLNKVTGNFTTIPTIDGLSDQDIEAVTSGIGIGQTVYEAEIHAGKALLTAKEHGQGAWMVFFDDKTVSGPLGKEKQITYTYASKELQALSEQTSLSVATLSKIQSILMNIGKKEINAHELAHYMQILPRSARRILLELEEKGIATVVGEENPHPRGRPRKIYRIDLIQG